MTCVYALLELHDDWLHSQDPVESGVTFYVKVVCHVLSVFVYVHEYLVIGSIVIHIVLFLEISIAIYIWALA